MLFRVVALLDTMWGNKPGLAPRYFRINPMNYSGKRLYRIVGVDTSLVVTNSCKELVTSAKAKGVPNPQWVAENLKRLEPFDVLLLCGKTAKKTFYSSKYRAEGAKVLEVMHPAARSWTNFMLDGLTKKISRLREKKSNPSTSDVKRRRKPQ